MKSGREWAREQKNFTDRAIEGRTDRKKRAGGGDGDGQSETDREEEKKRKREARRESWRMSRHNGLQIISFAALLSLES